MIFFFFFFFLCWQTFSFWKFLCPSATISIIIHIGNIHVVSFFLSFFLSQSIYMYHPHSILSIYLSIYLFFFLCLFVWIYLCFNQSISVKTFVCMYVCVFARFIYARGVMVIVVGNGHGDTSSNPGRDRLHFTSH